jgi:sugar lactone lactonase YvrE
MLRQEVLVSDYGDPNGWFQVNVPARIMIYSYYGAFLSKIDGGVTNTDFQFERPQGLAADGQGHIFMAESVRGEVFVFDRNAGTVLKKLGSFGDGPGQLELPLDLVLEKNGDLFVTNNMLRRIEVFRAAGGLE